MGNRLTQIATRTGDDGTTGLGDNTRISKNALRVHAMGDVDELNSNIGVLLCEDMPQPVRSLLVEIQHPTPFYDDSYGVNSANNGPYGDAIQYELIPEIERRFGGIGEGWARFVYGGSTGGWIAMAVQMFYPDDYNGAWIACPDPIDFRHYMTVNLAASGTGSAVRSTP